MLLASLVAAGHAAGRFPVASAGANDNVPRRLLARGAYRRRDARLRRRRAHRVADDRRRSHVSDVPVSSDQGLVEIGLGSNMVVGEGLDRWAGADGASTLWHDAGPNQLPTRAASGTSRPPSARPSSATPTTVIDARDRHGTVRARLYVDRATGLLLRREVLDSHGRAVHIVTFIALSQVDPTQPGVTSPTTPRAAKQRTNDTLTKVPDGYEAPGTAGSGFHLVARYRQGGGVVQLFYSDGLFNVSVFEQPGQLDWGALPSGGTDAHVSDERTLSYETAAGTVMFWNVQGSVFTCISDAPVDQVSAFVTSFANASTVGGGSNPVDDAIHFVLGPFSWG